MQKSHLLSSAALAMLFLSPTMANATPVACPVTTACKANFDPCLTPVGTTLICDDTSESVIYVGVYNGEGVDRVGVPLFTHTAPISGTHQWKTADTATAGTDSMTNGRANTTAMTSSAALRTAHPAATQCYNLGSQWYLPSIRELNVLSVAQRLNVSGIDTGVHWSSTQLSATYAWSQALSSGTQSDPNKTYGLSVRCLRR